MKTFWCSKKISSISWINNGVDLKPALDQCDMSKCPLWDDGFCLLSTKVMQGNHFHTIHTHKNITNLPKTKVCAIEKAFYVK